MKKIIGIIGIITLVFGIFFAGCTEQMSANEIAKKMEEKYNSINDMSANVIMTVDENGMHKTVEYYYIYKKPDKYYINSNAMIIVSNGKTMYVYDKKQNKYLKINNPPRQKADYGTIIKNMFKMYNIKYLGDGKVSGRDCYIIELIPKNETGNLAVDLGTVKMWVDKEYWQPLKLEIENNGQVTTTIIYQNVKYNTGVSDKIFEFVPPKNAKLINNTPPKMTVEEAQKEVSYKIFVPKYTAGYKFNYAVVSKNNGITSVVLIYKNAENKTLTIIESNSTENKSIPNSEKVKIGNTEGEFINAGNGNILSFRKDDLLYYIVSNMDKQDMINIAKSIVAQ